MSGDRIEPWWAAPEHRAPTLSVVIPAYNEATRLPAMLDEADAHLSARGNGLEIIVVDDGSTDATAEVAAAWSGQTPLRVLRAAVNRGKGHAVRMGMLAARGDLVLFADADGATPMRELDRLETALRSGAGVAIGSRALHSGTVVRDTRLHRRAMGRVFHGLVELLVGSSVRDTQCGFKLFTRPVAQRVFAPATSDGFSFDVEILSRVEALGVPVAEIAVDWSDVPSSRVRLASDSASMLIDLVRIRRRLRGFDAR